MAAELPLRPSATFQSILQTILTAFKSAFECHVTQQEHRASFAWTPADVKRLATEYVATFNPIVSLTDAQVIDLLLNDEQTDRFSVFQRIKFSAKFSSCSPDVKARLVVRIRELLACADVSIRTETAAAINPLESITPLIETARSAITAMPAEDLEAASRQIANSEGPFKFVFDTIGTMFPGVKRADGTVDMLGLVNQINSHIGSLLQSPPSS